MYLNLYQFMVLKVWRINRQHQWKIKKNIFPWILYSWLCIFSSQFLNSVELPSKHHQDSLHIHGQQKTNPLFHHFVFQFKYSKFHLRSKCHLKPLRKSQAIKISLYKVHVIMHKVYKNRVILCNYYRCKRRIVHIIAYIDKSVNSSHDE